MKTVGYALGGLAGYGGGEELELIEPVALAMEELLDWLNVEEAETEKLVLGGSGM